MKRKSAFLGCIVVMLSLISCVSYQKYSMEVYKPGERNLPSDMRKVAVVARNLKYETDTLQNFQAKNFKLYKDKVKFNVDSVAITACFDSLASRLLAQTRFDSVLIWPANSFPVTRVKEIRPAKAGWYKNLAAQTNADGLIVLDMFSCFYSVNTENRTANVVTSGIWSVYDARSGKIIDRATPIDTLYWDQLDETGQYKKFRLPGKKAAVALAAGVTGENYAKRFLPAWAVVYRDIMASSNAELKKAGSLALKNKWTEASVIWQKYMDSAGRRNRLIAAYNLALASEISGEVEQAIALIGQAARLSSGTENEAVRKYAAVLERRKQEIKQLEKQIQNQ